MLSQCPECELPVSDKALACPHCGYPLQNDSSKRKPRAKSNKRRRLPNGFGQISEIKNRNLRNPFRAMVTVGKDPNGRPICKPLKPVAYFPTYNDAYAALVEYNRNPYDLSESITIAELYDKWIEGYEKTIKNINGVRNAWLYCSGIYNMRVQDVRARHIKSCMEEGTAVIRGITKTPTSYVKSNIKLLFNKMLDYAVEYEIVDRNYARTFALNNEVKRELSSVQNEHIPFTDEEMQVLWSHVNDKKYIDIILIQCYSGWRPQELGLIELSNVDLENWTFTGGIKTESGTNRLVPIHSRIQPLVAKRYREAESIGSKYLFNYIDSSSKSNDFQLTYPRYQRHFSMIRDELNLNPAHRPHDGRKHFVTQAKRYGVDEYAIKYMVGHKVSDITEKVYTARDQEWLKMEIEKIK